MSANKYPGVLFIGLAFGLAWATIAFTTVLGNPMNSLHGSAQAWAFTIVIGVLVSYGLSWLGEAVVKRAGD